MTDRYKNIRKALAMGPTKGPWFHGAANGSHMYCVYDKRCWTDEDGTRHGETPNMVVYVSPDDGKYANAALIAACDPDTIRELLAERDQLAAALEAAREALDREAALKGGVEHQRDTLWAELEAAREDAEFFRWLAVHPNLYTVCDLLRADQYATLRRACESLAAIDQSRGIVPEAGQGVGDGGG